MKNTSLILALFVLVGICTKPALFGQTNSLGIFGQFGPSNLSGFPHSQVGGRAGITGSMVISEKFDFNTALAFSSLADKEVVETTGGSHDFLRETARTRLSYLDVTPDIAFKAGNRFAISLGPYAAFLLNARTNTLLEYTDSTASGNSLVIQEKTGLYKWLDFGARARVSYKVLDGLLVEVVFSQAFQNASVLGFFGVKHVPQSILGGLRWQVLGKGE